MIKKTIKFTDFDGVEKSEDHYFNINKSELFKMEVTAKGNSLQEYMKQIVEANDGKEIMRVFEEILAMSYGVRSEDGKRFIKSKQIFEEFTQTPAYDEFFFEIVTDADKMAQFCNGVLPGDLQEKSGLTVEEIKAQTLAKKGGFNKAEEKTMTVVKDIPTESSEETPAPDLSTLSREELEERLRNQSGQ